MSVELVTTSFSIPRKVLVRLDAQRGDVPRSRYLVRILEKEFRSQETMKI